MSSSEGSSSGYELAENSPKEKDVTVVSSDDESSTSSSSSSESTPPPPPKKEKKTKKHLKKVDKQQPVSQSKRSFKITTRKNPVDISFVDIDMEVNYKKRFKTYNKQILKGISGYCKAGQLLAILGGSGAGKSSLMNVLSGRMPAAAKLTRGSVKINGTEIKSSHMGHFSCYVMQDDVLLPNLTIRETLMFSAMLRLPESISKKDKEQRVEDVIQELGLSKSANSMIGSTESRGISGGEKKRVNIGVELITDPSLMFLDEPTSGLDSFTAYNIMETLIHLANSGRTVVCTIHQPRSNIFALFDMLLILSEGSPVYFGPAKKAVSYFSRLNFICPTYANPADYVLDISSVDSRSPESADSSKKQVQSLIENYKTSKQAKIVKKEISKIDKKSTNTLEERVGYPTGIFHQTYWLFIRSWKNFYKDVFVTLVRGFQILFFAVLVGLIYLRMDNDQTSITDRVGLLFFIIVNQSFGSVFAVVNSFFVEKLVFMRERASKTYHVTPYYLTRAVTEFPGQFLFTVGFCVISYYMTGLQPAFDKFLIYTIVILLVTFNALSIGLFLSAVLPSIDVVNAMAPLIIVILLLFGGFYINTSNIPVYFIWIEYFSYFKWAFSAVMQNEFDGLKLKCNEDQLTSGDNGTEFCPITSGEQVLLLYGLEDDIGIAENIIVLISLIIFWRLLGYLGIRFLAKKTS